MTKTFTVHEAKTHLSKLIAEALAGGDVVIARGKEPAVRLVPIAPVRKPSLLGAMKGHFELPDSFFDPLSDEDLRDWGMIS